MMVQLFHRMSKQQNDNSTQVVKIVSFLTIRKFMDTLNNLFNFTLTPNIYFVLF